MSRYILVKTNTEKCSTIYGKTCEFDEDNDWCENCAEVYEGESQHVIDELLYAGYDVEDICEQDYQYNNHEHSRTWWVVISGKKEKEPDLDIIS